MQPTRPPILRATFDRAKLVVDLFAGGGGTSEGLYDAFGFAPDIAANHDPEAVAMHMANHPKTKHYIEDVRRLDIPKVTGGRGVGLLWLSPDCKHHSVAKGGKPVDRKIRGLAWEAVRWADKARPDVIILENVKEFRGWGPVRRADNRPCPKRKGVTYRQFKRALEERGYVVEDRNLRACDYGAPTSRERLFLVARCDGRPIVWPEPTHAEKGKGGLLPWRTAAECIDFSLPCPSIFETSEEIFARWGLRTVRPLAANTMARVARGVERYVRQDPEPFIVPYYGLKNDHDVRAHRVDSPLPTQTGDPKFSLVTPFVMPLTHHDAQRGAQVTDPLRTITGANRGEQALVAPTLVQTGYGEREGQAPRALEIRKPLGTVVGAGKHALVSAFLAQHNGGYYDARGGAGRRAAAPISTITGAGAHQQLVAAHLLKLKGSARSSASVAAPLDTVQAGGGHYAEVRAFLIKYHATGHNTCSLNAPAATVVANDSLGLVTVHGALWAIVDIGMRMLTPRELFRCQGFSDTYIIDVPVQKTRHGKVVELRLSATAQVRMVGNSVPPAFAKALALANFGRVVERVAA